MSTRYTASYLPTAPGGSVGAAVGTSVAQAAAGETGLASGTSAAQGAAGSVGIATGTSTAIAATVTGSAGTANGAATAQGVAGFVGLAFGISDATAASVSEAVTRFGGFEMVSIEPAWRKALRIRQEAKDRIQVKLENKRARKRAQLIERLAAKEALSTKQPTAIDARLQALMAEWLELKPSIAIDIPELNNPEAAFMAQVALRIARIQQEDDEAAAMLLLM